MSDRFIAATHFQAECIACPQKPLFPTPNHDHPAQVDIEQQKGADMQFMG